MYTRCRIVGDDNEEGLKVAIVSQVDDEGASDEVRREFDDQVQKHVCITNMKRTLLHSVPAFKA
jgi:hypothetical protein